LNPKGGSLFLYIALVGKKLLRLQKKDIPISGRIKTERLREEYEKEKLREIMWERRMCKN